MNHSKQLREASGLTQLEVAKRAGLERSRLSLFESGYVVLTAREERALRRVLLSALRKRVAHLQSVLTQVDPREGEQAQQRAAV